MKILRAFKRDTVGSSTHYTRRRIACCPKEMQLSTTLPSLHYAPNRDVDKAVIAVGSRSFDLKVHPVTVSKPNGVTPRHFCSQELVEALNPPLVTPSVGETVHVRCSTAAGGGHLATVLFCGEKSVDPVLRSVWTLYTAN